MISIIISFRFPSGDILSAEEKASISVIFDYWENVMDEYGVELVLINDFSDGFWVQKPYIYLMKGDKVDWNMAAARNFGASLASGDKFLFTDIDHFLFGDYTQLDLFNIEDHVIQFKRVIQITEHLDTIKIHPNTFMVKKEFFLKYDEDFCGNYGHEDSELFFRFKQFNRFYIFPPDQMISYVFDIPRPQLNRDTSINKALLDSKIRSFRTLQSLRPDAAYDNSI